MPKFDISLAAWSLHKMFFAKEIDQMGMVDFTAKHGIGGFEMVNTFFPSPQYAYLKQLKQRADDQNVKLLLIMCDGEGSMAQPEKEGRLQAAKNHHKWIDIAAVLGCHSIRCNTGAREGDPDALGPLRRVASPRSSSTPTAPASTCSSRTTGGSRPIPTGSWD